MALAESRRNFLKMPLKVIFNRWNNHFHKQYIYANIFKQFLFWYHVSQDILFKIT